MCVEDVSLKFDIINPTTNKNSPRYDSSINLFSFPVTKSYKYYIEARSINEDTSEILYYLLLSKHKFNDNCRICEVNQYNKCKIHPKGEFKDYISKEIDYRGNITCKLVDANSNYDVYSIV